MEYLKQFHLRELVDFYNTAKNLLRIFSDAKDDDGKDSQLKKMDAALAELDRRQSTLDAQTKELADLHRKRQAEFASLRATPLTRFNPEKEVRLGDLSAAKTMSLRMLGQALRGAAIDQWRAEGEEKWDYEDRAAEAVYAILDELHDRQGAFEAQAKELDGLRQMQSPTRWASIAPRFQDNDDGKRAPRGGDRHECESGVALFYFASVWGAGRDKDHISFICQHCPRCGGLLPTADRHEGMEGRESDNISLLKSVWAHADTPDLRDVNPSMKYRVYYTCDEDDESTKCSFLTLKKIGVEAHHGYLETTHFGGRYVFQNETAGVNFHLRSSVKGVVRDGNGPGHYIFEFGLFTGGEIISILGPTSRVDAAGAYIERKIREEIDRAYTELGHLGGLPSGSPNLWDCVGAMRELALRLEKSLAAAMKKVDEKVTRISFFARRVAELESDKAQIIKERDASVFHAEITDRAFGDMANDHDRRAQYWEKELNALADFSSENLAKVEKRMAAVERSRDTYARTAQELGTKLDAAHKEIERLKYIEKTLRWSQNRVLSLEGLYEKNAKEIARLRALVVFASGPEWVPVKDGEKLLRTDEWLDPTQKAWRKVELDGVPMSIAFTIHRRRSGPGADRGAGEPPDLSALSPAELLAECETYTAARCEANARGAAGDAAKAEEVLRTLREFVKNRRWLAGHEALESKIKALLAALKPFADVGRTCVAGNGNALCFGGQTISEYRAAAIAYDGAVEEAPAPPKCEDCKWFGTISHQCLHLDSEYTFAVYERRDGRCGKSGENFDPCRRVAMPAPPDAARNEYAGEKEEVAEKSPTKCEDCRYFFEIFETGKYICRHREETDPRHEVERADPDGLCGPSGKLFESKE